MIKYNKKLIRQLNKKGSLLGVALISMVVFSVIGIALLTTVTGQYAVTNRSVFTANALLVAEAGLEETLHELNQDDDFPGYTAERTFLITSSKGGVFLKPLLVEQLILTRG